jgi:chromosome segregation ATPase
MLGGWEKQFKEKMELLGRKRGEAESELVLAREAHAAELKRVLDEAALLKGARDRDWERCDAAESKLASARARNESLVAEKMRHISEERSNNRSIENLKAELAATRTRVEEANHSYKNLKAKSITELEENISVLERVEADATALWSSHTAAVTRLEEASEGLMRKVEELNHSNEILKAESVSEMERINSELEKAVLLADQRSNHVLTLAFERNQAKTELERLLLERNTTNA